MRVFCFLCCVCVLISHISWLFFLIVECSRFYFLSLVFVFNVSITVFLLQPVDLISS